MKLHSSFTFEHSNRVMDLTMGLASELGIDDQQQLENLKRAAFFKDIGQYGPDDLSSFPGQEDGEVVKYIKEIKNSLRECSNLHDIGKMRISGSILNKEGTLDDEEFAQIKLHPLIGVEIVRPFPELQGAISAIRGHHERWDGTGYPDGKKGEQIPIEARIISICDAFDAMTSDRPYRKAMSYDSAIQELFRCAGTQFDPELIPLFIYALAKKEGIDISIYEEKMTEIKEKFNFKTKKRGEEKSSQK
jgi:HD-GYP domain-containing protein (c-di-GMP phosphodiesterase class II)